MNAKIKLLLAEDEAALGQIIKESLETRDFEVLLCDNGDKAFETYKTQQPDVLVLDVMMPKRWFYFSQRNTKHRPKHSYNISHGKISNSRCG